MTDDYNAADNSAKSYALAIDTMREKLQSFRQERIGDCWLLQGDCREILPLLPKVDAVVTDPPYGIGEAAGANKSRGKLAAAKDYGVSDWDDKPAQDEVEKAIAGAKWAVVFGGNYYNLPPSSCWLVWDKVNGETDFADCELAWTNLPKAVRRIAWQWNGFLRKGEMSRAAGGWAVRHHPTEKPVGVMKWAIGHIPDPNRVIMDPFMGSGTTGVAAVNLGRRFIGIEREPKYFEIACKRIRDAYAQPDFFVEAAKAPPAEQLDLLKTEAAE
jgi:DNA modification methylase